MSDNRKRPIARRFKPETEALLQVYAKSRNITANEAAEQLLHGNAGVVVDAAAEIKKLRAAVTRAENVAAAREKQRDDALADLAAERVTAGVLRAELESAREATRRADAALAELEQANRDLALDVASLRKMHAAEKGAHERCAAEIERLTRELAGERLKTEAAQAREQQARTEAADLQARRSGAAPCACALPADFEAKLTERLACWKGTLPELRAHVVKLGFQRYDALANDAAKRAAERGR